MSDRHPGEPRVHHVTAKQRRAMEIEARRAKGKFVRARSLAAIEAELATAKNELQRLENAYDGYSGNNPNKLDRYSRDISSVRVSIKVLETERVLKLRDAGRTETGEGPG